MPSTAVGDADGTVGEGDELGGDADELGWPGEAGGDALLEPGAVCVGEPAGAGDCEDDATSEGDAAGDGELATELGDAINEAIADGVALTWPGAGPIATSRGWPASTAAPSATSTSIAAIGTMPIRLPRGRSSRQFGQKPETGVAT